MILCFRNMLWCVIHGMWNFYCYLLWMNLFASTNPSNIKLCCCRQGVPTHKPGYRVRHCMFTLEQLYLKKDAPVGVMQNMQGSDVLINGSRGTVKDFDADGVHVFFPYSLRCWLERNHSASSIQSQSVVSNRRQIPLRLGFTLTVHKALKSSPSYLQCRSESRDAEHVCALSEPSLVCVSCTDCFFTRVLFFANLGNAPSPNVTIFFPRPPPDSRNLGPSCCFARENNFTFSAVSDVILSLILLTKSRVRTRIFHNRSLALVIKTCLEQTSPR